MMLRRGLLLALLAASLDAREFYVSQQHYR